MKNKNVIAAVLVICASLPFGAFADQTGSGGPGNSGKPQNQSEAFSSTIMVCHNQNTGAEIDLSQPGVYSNQDEEVLPPNYQMNAILLSNLKGQLGGATVIDQGSGVVTEGDSWFSFTSGSLALGNKNGERSEAGIAYLLTYGTAQFKFNPGECRSQ